MPNTDPSQPSPEGVTPDRLLGAFTRTPIGRAYVLSGVAHVAFILLLSLGYLRDTWIDPEGARARAEARKARAIQQAGPAAEPSAAAEPAPAPPAAAPASPPAAAASPASTPPKTDEQLLEERKDTAVGRALTETANPAEIAPGGEGLPLGR